MLSVNLVTSGADAAANTARDIDLYFAKSINGTAPVTMGNANATITAAPIVKNHMIGMSHLETTEHGNAAIDYWNVAQTGSGAAASMIPNLVIQGEPESGTNVGYDKIYISASIGGAYSFGTTVLARGGTTADGSVAVVETDKGANDDPDADLIFAVGDVLHSATNDVLGTVKSIGAFGSSKQDITFEAAIEDTIADNEEIFNVYPIKLVLSFER